MEHLDRDNKFFLKDSFIDTVYRHREFYSQARDFTRYTISFELWSLDAVRQQLFSVHVLISPNT